eukprot:g7711.t1
MKRADSRPGESIETTVYAGGNAWGIAGAAAASLRTVKWSYLGLALAGILLEGVLGVFILSTVGSGPSTHGAMFLAGCYVMVLSPLLCGRLLFRRAQPAPVDRLHNRVLVRIALHSRSLSRRISLHNRVLGRIALHSRGVDRRISLHDHESRISLHNRKRQAQFEAPRARPLVSVKWSCLESSAAFPSMPTSNLIPLAYGRASRHCLGPRWLLASTHNTGVLHLLVALRGKVQGVADATVAMTDPVADEVGVSLRL